MDIIKKRSPSEAAATRQCVTFPDPGAFRSLSGWDVELRQLEPGPMKATAHVWAGRGLSVIDLSMSQPTYQAGVAKRGKVSFGLPDANSVKNWLGTRPSPGQLMIFGTEDPFEGVGLSGFSGLIFSIDEDHAKSIGEHIGMDVGPLIERASGSSICQLAKKDACVSTEARKLIAGSVYCGDGNEDNFVARLLELLSMQNAWHERQLDKNRNRAVRLSIELMNEHPTDNLPISRICREVGVSAVTLRRAFLEKYGIGPKQFYLRSRICRVREKLLLGEAPTVSDVANDFGFWHMGQFAKDYRSMFDETPSETLEARFRCYRNSS